MAVQVLWDPQRWWMGCVHVELHKLKMSEGIPNGVHVQAMILEIYLESCRHASSQWRKDFARRQSAADTVLIKLHWQERESILQEAITQVQARYNHDADDWLTLTGISPRMGQGS